MRPYSNFYNADTNPTRSQISRTALILTGCPPIPSSIPPRLHPVALPHAAGKRHGTTGAAGGAGEAKNFVSVGFLAPGVKYVITRLTRIKESVAGRGLGRSMFSVPSNTLKSKRPDWKETISVS